MVKVEMDRKLKTFYILVAIVMAFNFIGALFKIMHWPGAGKFLMIGIPLPFVVLLPAYLLANPTEKGINYKNLLAILFFFAYFAAISSILSIRVSYNVVHSFDAFSRSIQEKSMILKENTAMISGHTDINNPINEEAERLCMKIAYVESIILSGDQHKLSSKHTVYLDVRPVIETSYLTELKTEIIHFGKLVQRQYGSNSRIYRYVEETISIYTDSTEGIPWEDAWLNKNIIASAIESLNLLEFRVRLIQIES
jgi:hypothetical protein